MFQNRTIVFEKVDIEAMKRGEVISIKQSDGSQLDFAYDRARKPKEDKELGEAYTRDMELNPLPRRKTKTLIIEFLKKAGPSKAREISEGANLRKDQIYPQLTKLRIDGIAKNDNGLWSLTPKGLK